MTVLGPIIGIVLCFFYGLAMVRALTADNGKMPIELEIGLAFPVGAGLAGYAAYLQVLFKWPLPFEIVTAIGLLASGYFLFKYRRAARLSWSMPLWLTILIAVLGLAALFLAAAGPFGGGDGVWVHGFKARHLLRDNTWTNPVFLDPDVVHCNETTPLWGAAFLWFMARFAGVWRDPWPYLGLVFFFPSGLLISYGYLKEKLDSEKAVLFTLALSLTPAFALSAGGVFSHYLDVPLGVVILAGAILIDRGFDHSDGGSLALAVFLTVVAITMKNEGLFYAAAFALFSAARVHFSKNKSALLPALWMLLLSAWPMPFHFIFRSLLPVGHDQIWFRQLSAETFWQNLDRTPEIFIKLAGILADPSRWGLWWVLLFAAAAAGARKKIKPAEAVFLLPAAVIFSSSFFIYWQDYMDFREHITWSFDRLVLQVLPCAVMWMALQTKNYPDGIIPVRFFARRENAIGSPARPKS